MNESREGVCRTGRGRSFHVDGPKTEKAREPTVESLARGIWRLRASEAEWRVLIMYTHAKQFRGDPSLFLN